MRLGLTLLVAAGCYHPALPTGAPCSDTQPCPSPLVCDPDANYTCQRGYADGGLSDGAPDGEILIDGCTPSPEICGDGIDQDCNGSDPACPANDKPGGAIDVTAGGNFTMDMRYATDDVTKPNNSSPACGNSVGRDVFYKVHLAADETYYFDTFGSDFDTVIRVTHGACAGGVAPGGTQCHNNSCGTPQTQGIFDLTAGDTCIVIDQNGTQTNGMLKLRVEHGRRTGTSIDTGGPTTVTGDTTNSSDQMTGGCGAAGHDDGYYFTACPGQTLTINATTCNAATTWNTALYVRQSGPTQVTCNNDDAACTANTGASTIAGVTVTGNHLYYLIVDSGADGAQGGYEVDADIE